MLPVTRSARPLVSIVAAARPNFMKVGPVIRALGTRAQVEMVHTGQHYDARMSQGFFDELGLPTPDRNLGVGSGSHATQTADVMVAYEEHLLASRPNAIVVVGDVNSTVACALAGVKLGIPVAHVEAGLRSGDWTMPEEINRLVTDRLSQWLFTTSADADENLAAEGVPASRVHLVGNVMIDTLLANLERARDRGDEERRRLGLEAGRYGMLTLHRPSNVDEAEDLGRLMATLSEVDPDLPMVFPAHPRTAGRLREFGFEAPAQVRMVEPMGYLSFVGLLDGAAIALTDSGGVQEETSVLGVPCVTLRENTERPVTCTLGTNVLAGTEHEAVLTAARGALATGRRDVQIPLWDGEAGPRIADVLLADLLG